MNDVAIKEETQSLLSVIERVAMSPEADIAKLEKMLDMQERVLNRNARQAFASAFAEMQAEIPEIEEKGIGHNIKYATLEDINEVVKPILTKYGFGVSFRVKQSEGGITVTGVLFHRDGHSEETEMTLQSDTSGSKNNVQAVGSSVSYGKRYVLCALLNISTRGEDDNGQKAGQKVTEFQADKIKDVLMGCSEKTRDYFKETYGAVVNVPRNEFNQVLAKLEKAKAANNANP